MRLARAVAFINDGMEQGAFTPAVDKVFPLAKIEDACLRLPGKQRAGWQSRCRRSPGRRQLTPITAQRNAHAPSGRYEPSASAFARDQASAIELTGAAGGS
jgi:hypothetical protein